tara:strand:- start:79 stop:459 length:381 start_codon:yes stop_codon:yes gene_type:complete
MKTIKLTIVGLMLSAFSYGQDTIRKMVAGKNLNVYDLHNTHIVSSTDFLHEGSYVSYKINIPSNEVLLLHLYDDCLFCDTSILYRELVINKGSSNSKTILVKSSSNEYYFNGVVYSSVTIKKPENE